MRLNSAILGTEHKGRPPRSKLGQDAKCANCKGLKSLGLIWPSSLAQLPGGDRRLGNLVA